MTNILFCNVYYTTLLTKVQCYFIQKAKMATQFFVHFIYRRKLLTEVCDMC